jgi:hypothetical protein
VDAGHVRNRAAGLSSCTQHVVHRTARERKRRLVSNRITNQFSKLTHQKNLTISGRFQDGGTCSLLLSRRWAEACSSGCRSGPRFRAPRFCSGLRRPVLTKGRPRWSGMRNRKAAGGRYARTDGFHRRKPAGLAFLYRCTDPRGQGVRHRPRLPVRTRHVAARFTAATPRPRQKYQA